MRGFEDVVDNSIYKKLFDKNNSEKLIEAVKKGLDINLTDKSDMALFYDEESFSTTFYKAAIMWGTPELVRTCVEHGADVNTFDKKLARKAFPAVSTLVAAMLSLNTENLNELLKLGANPNLLIRNGILWELRSSLCPENENDLKFEREKFSEFKRRLEVSSNILRILKDAGCHIPGTQEYDDNESFYDIRFNAELLSIGDKAGFVKREDKFFFEQTMQNKFFPFAFPCQGTRPKALWHSATPLALKERLKDCENINFHDKAGWTALHHLASYGSTGYYFMPEAMIQILLDAGADINAVNGYGVTPLMLACDRAWQVNQPRGIEIIKVLIRNGANIELRDTSGDYTAFDWLTSEWNNCLWCVRNMLACVFNEIVYSCSGKGLSSVDIDLLTTSFWGTPKDLEAVLLQGGDINLRTSKGYTPLMIASLFNEPESVQYLIDKGAELEAEYKKGHTALYLAGESGDKRVVSVLKNAGADYSVLDVSDQEYYQLSDDNIFGSLSRTLKSYGLEI